VHEEATSSRGTEERGPVHGPVQPTRGALSRLRPLGLHEVALGASGALGAWQERNRHATIPHCITHVESSGALSNLERAAKERVPGSTHEGMVFSDSDVYKVLEAVAWESVRGLPGASDQFAARATSAIASAQRDDGYLNSWVLGEHPELLWKDLRWGHELYCAGHLLQASVAAQRTGSLPGLADVAAKLVDHLAETFSTTDGDGRLLGVSGHPQVEAALVEHYRQTGDERALRLAVRQVDLRGRPDVALPSSGAIDSRPFVLAYFLHHLPVRARRSATGHAVRELYLQSGVVDVATETHDEELLAASEAIWEDLYATKTYLNGAHGSRHRDESIGDAYELPSDRAYAETCAAIASFLWNWRLLLATGRDRYAQAMERVLWNTVAGAVSAGGTEFFYSNTLHLRTGHQHGDEDAPARRLPWYACACCPPNLARLVASVQAYLVTRDASGLQVHVPFTGTLSTEVPGGRAEIELSSAHPFGGESQIAVRTSASRTPWAISVRAPEWAPPSQVRAELNGEPLDARASEGYLRVERSWCDGDVVRISVPTPIRVVTAHPRVDAARGCVAVERGPLVYCLEADDLAEGQVVEDVVVDVAGPFEATAEVPSQLATYVEVTIRAQGWHAPSSSLPLYGLHGERAPEPSPTRFVLVPYFARSLRSSAAMRVWLPALRGAAENVARAGAGDAQQRPKGSRADGEEHGDG